MKRADGSHADRYSRTDQPGGREGAEYFGFDLAAVRDRDRLHEIEGLAFPGDRRGGDTDHGSGKINEDEAHDQHALQGGRLRRPRREVARKDRIRILHGGLDQADEEDAGHHQRHDDAVQQIGGRALHFEPFHSGKRADAAGRRGKALLIAGCQLTARPGLLAHADDTVKIKEARDQHENAVHYGYGSQIEQQGCRGEIFQGPVGQEQVGKNTDQTAGCRRQDLSAGAVLRARLHGIGDHEEAGQDRHDGGEDRHGLLAAQPFEYPHHDDIDDPGVNERRHGQSQSDDGGEDPVERSRAGGGPVGDIHGKGHEYGHIEAVDHGYRPFCRDDRAG